MNRQSIPLVPQRVIVAVTMLAGLLCGRLLADGKAKYGLAIILAGLYAPIVFFDLPVAIAMWGGVLFIKDLHALSVAPNTMGVLIALAFIGMLVPQLRTLPVLAQQRRLTIAVLLLLLWLTISAAWAEQPGTALSQSAFWWLGGLAFLIVMVSLRTGRDVSLIALALVAGAFVAACIGLATGGLSTGNSNIGVTATTVNGRLTGGGGDPNLQAAGFVAAMFLSMGLLQVYRRRWLRTSLIFAFAIITVAFFATESRGGLLALGVAAIVALAVFPDQRKSIFTFLALGAGIAAIAAASNPGSLTRITNFGGGTSGRSDIWSVAVTVFKEHPLVGVGLNNFQVVEPRFSLEPRTVSRVTYIAETPFPAHNTYLQLLAEDGVIGLIAFAAVTVMSLRAALLAAREFERRGRYDYAHLARSVLIGSVGMLTAIFFFSDGDDLRLWILFGLGPALLALARSLPLTTGRAIR
ncbi:MAG: O-antigen ligase family protein [Solirubrobacteraceae bacterium]